MQVIQLSGVCFSEVITVSSCLKIVTVLLAFLSNVVASLVEVARVKRSFAYLGRQNSLRYQIPHSPFICKLPQVSLGVNLSEDFDSSWWGRPIRKLYLEKMPAFIWSRSMSLCNVVPQLRLNNVILVPGIKQILSSLEREDRTSNPCHSHADQADVLTCTSFRLKSC